MIHIAIGIALLIGILISPGTNILSAMINMDVAKSVLEPYKLHLLSIAVNFWIPAIIFHQIILRSRLNVLFNPSKKLSNFIIASNFIIILYLLARVFASTVEGGGGTYLVRSFSIFTLVPATITLAVSLTILIKQAFTNEASFDLKSSSKGSMFLATIFIPLLYISYIIFGGNSSFKETKSVENTFNKYCELSGEVIHKTIDHKIESVFISAGERLFRFDAKGKVRSSGIGDLSSKFLNRKILSFVEMNNSRAKSRNEGVYTVVMAQQHPHTTSDTLKSNYGVISTQLVSDEERKLGISGEEVSVINLSNNEVLAKTIYFYSKPHRLFCGHIENNTYSTYEFVMRVLNFDSGN